MPRSRSRRPTCVLAVAIGWGACAAAYSQENILRPLSDDPTYPVPFSSPRVPPRYAASVTDSPVESGEPATEDQNLADRVNELEETITAMREKEAAASRTAAGRPSVSAGGRIMVDWANFSQNADSLNQGGDFFNGTEFRRARLFLAGEGFDVVEYEIEFDFAGQTDFKDVHMTIKELPWLGHIRIGHFKEPFSLEELTSSRYMTFMERGLNNVFAPGRNTGVMAFDYSDSEHMTWAIGAFTTLIGDNPPTFPDEPFDDAGGTSLTMRCTALPWYDEATNGRGLIHTGICYTYRDIPELRPSGTERFALQAQPEAHLAGDVADTGFLEDASTVHALDAELAWVYGPFSIQSEYTVFWLNRTVNSDAVFHGAYVYASWFFTGEHRAYKRTAGKFDRVRPFENFFRVRTEDGNVHTGKGAWELAYRCSYLDLSDANVRGGRVVDHTLGLNWYLNGYTRMMFNYVHSDADDTQLGPGTGTVDLFQMRAQIDF